MRAARAATRCRVQAGELNCSLPRLRPVTFLAGLAFALLRLSGGLTLLGALLAAAFGLLARAACFDFD